MSYDQIFLFVLLGIVFAMLVWGRVRYDLVAFAGLVIAVIGGVVPVQEAMAAITTAPGSRRQVSPFSSSGWLAGCSK